MKMFGDLIHRQRDDSLWRKIPWDDANFSRRMLQQHLSQEHDAASRRLPKIDQAVDWIHNSVLEGKPSSILDLGCGPGLYTDRFVTLGHSCIGIDFGPASIEYARKNHAGDFILADVVTAEYGDSYDLVCLLYGELNAFSPPDAKQIVEKAYRALKPGGFLLLEILQSAAIRRMGNAPPTWHTEEQGLWSDEPHLVLQESSFADGHSCSWYYIVDAATGAMEQYVAMHQAYTQTEYDALLASFGETARYAGITGDSQGDGEFSAIVAKK